MLQSCSGYNGGHAAPLYQHNVGLGCPWAYSKLKMYRSLASILAVIDIPWRHNSISELLPLRNIVLQMTAEGSSTCQAKIPFTQCSLVHWYNQTSSLYPTPGFYACLYTFSYLSNNH